MALVEIRRPRFLGRVLASCMFLNPTTGTFDNCSNFSSGHNGEPLADEIGN